MHISNISRSLKKGSSHSPLRWLRSGLIAICLIGLGSLALLRLPAADAEHAPPPQIAPSTLPGPNPAPQTTFKVFLPLILKPVTPPLIPMLVGTSPVGQYIGSQTIVDQYLKALDTWSGRQHTFAGTFLGLEDPCSMAFCLTEILTRTWSNGYTAFININPDGRSAAAVASGCCDSSIQTWADTYLAWTAQGGNRRAFLAPMPEANWCATSWSCDPENFVLAYRRIKTIFEQRGVSRSKVWWVFAPNGFTDTRFTMSRFYPGDADVDIIGYSSYNQSCLTAWMNPAEVFQYTNLIRNTVSSTKPIFIAQTGSASNAGDKDQWMRDAYNLLYQQGVRGVIYFNGDNTCDWAIYRPGAGVDSQGYKDAVSSSITRYLSPSVLSTTTLPP